MYVEQLRGERVLWGGKSLGDLELRRTLEMAKIFLGPTKKSRKLVYPAFGIEHTTETAML